MTLERHDIWKRIDSLTKPPRSLGRLEDLAARLCEVQQTLKPRATPRRLVLFAADHGVAAAGVTAWPSAVTGLMVRNILTGRAASTVLARQSATEAVLVDVGTFESEDEPMSAPAAGIEFRACRVRSGTRDLSREPALSVGEFEQALEIGRNEARRAAADGVRILAAGEMGIGNTTPSACLAMLLADVPLEHAVGRGAGADDATLNQKRQIVGEAVARAREQFKSLPRGAIASVSGLEIAAMAGLFMSAHEARLTVILDGYVASAAALVAEHLLPGTRRSLLASHLSQEPGHRFVLQRLQLSPFLDWNLRLGEGTGALLLMPLLDAAAAMIGEMATFDDLGIAARPKS